MESKLTYTYIHYWSSILSVVNPFSASKVFHVNCMLTGHTAMGNSAVRIAGYVFLPVVPLWACIYIVGVCTRSILFLAILLWRSVHTSVICGVSNQCLGYLGIQLSLGKPSCVWKPTCSHSETNLNVDANAFSPSLLIVKGVLWNMTYFSAVLVLSGMVLFTYRYVLIVIT